MTLSPVTTPTASNDGSVKCFVAIELSKKSWQLGISLPHQDRMRVEIVSAGDGSGLLSRLETLREQAERAVEQPVEVVTCYEAGYDGFWLHRLMTGYGITSYVFDPASLLVNRRARRAKTDRLDLKQLLRSLKAYDRGERDMVSVVCVPSLEDEDAKQLHRERRRLVNERVQHTNCIKGLCALHGVYDFEPERARRFERLEALRTYEGEPFPSRLQAELRRQLERLELVMRMIAELNAECRALAISLMQSHPNADKIARLAQLKGMGPIFSAVLVGEVFYRAFDNRRQVAAYAGLAPSPFASGGMERDQGISKAGNALVRTTMIEAAWVWLRHQPDSALARWFTDRVGTLKGRPRRINIVALARKLLIALWRYAETGLVPTGARLKSDKTAKPAA